MTGPDVVLLHGFGTSWKTTWRDNGWVDLLRDAGREVVAFDLLGHGDAPKPHEPEAYAALEAYVADRLPAGVVDIVAFSLGARVALTLAAERPERFRRVVVGGVGENLFRERSADVIVRALRGDAPDDDPVVRYFAQLGRAPGSDAAALAALLSSPRPPLTPDVVARVTVPVLVVLGDRDFAGPPDPLVEALPDATLVTLPGGDHFSAVKDFRFIDAALDFLGAAPG